MTQNVGIIGMGKHAEQSHLEFLDPASIGMVADLDSGRMSAVSDRLGLDARQTTDWQEVVGSEAIDTVFVMTPDRLHTPQLVAAVAMGKHVFCEKPLADNLKDYRKLSDTLSEAADNDIVVSTCHPRRFDPPFMRVKSFLDDRALLGEAFGLPGDLGNVIGMDFKFRYHKPGKEGLHQSLMFDHLGHEIDLANYFFGVSSLRQAVRLHDSQVCFGVSAERADGIELSFRGSRGLDAKIYQEDVHIDFDRGSLAMDRHHGTATLRREDMTAHHTSPEYKTDYDQRFRAINDHFIRATQGLEVSYITADEMRMNTLAAIALYGADGAVAVRV